MIRFLIRWMISVALFAVIAFRAEFLVLQVPEVGWRWGAVAGGAGLLAVAWTLIRYLFAAAISDESGAPEGEAQPEKKTGSAGSDESGVREGAAEAEKKKATAESDESGEESAPEAEKKAEPKAEPEAEPAHEEKNNRAKPAVKVAVVALPDDAKKSTEGSEAKTEEPPKSPPDGEKEAEAPTKSTTKKSDDDDDGTDLLEMLPSNVVWKIVAGVAALTSLGLLVWVSVKDSEPDSPEKHQAVDPDHPLQRLSGAWRSDSGRAYDAVYTGTAVEFRIKDAMAFPGQGYAAGEARFSLTLVPGSPDLFKVEDRIRPLPPKGMEYDLRTARESCQAIWTSADGDPLRARVDGDRLTIDAVKVTPDLRMFKTEGQQVIACRHLHRSQVDKIQSVLTRM